MATQIWRFSPLSCSLMSLLASRTHEWRSWTIAEGGMGAVDPQNVSWVELQVDLNGTLRSLRSSKSDAEQALCLFESLLASNESQAPFKDEEWQSAWQSGAFLSEFDAAGFPEVSDQQEWRLIRGSAIKPELWLRRV